MLGTVDAVSMLAVRDLKVARHFYETTLGLEFVEQEGDEVLVFRSGKTLINVYRSQYAGTNQATALMWQVKDLDAEMRELKSRGITFEHYDLPGLKREGDVHVAEGFRTAWFKDPDGNILNIGA